MSFNNFSKYLHEGHVYFDKLIPSYIVAFRMETYY